MSFIIVAGVAFTAGFAVGGNFFEKIINEMSGYQKGYKDGMNHAADLLDESNKKAREFFK